MEIVKATVNVNDRRKRDMAQKVIEACGGSLEGKTVAIPSMSWVPRPAYSKTLAVASAAMSYVDRPDRRTILVSE